jgi:hypothetical protein
VDLITSLTLDFVPGRGLRVAVSFDEQTPQVLDAFAKQDFANPSTRPDQSSPAIQDWGTWMRDNARTIPSTHAIREAGVHTLKVWMVDPGVVLERLIVHHNDLHPSYFGPAPPTALPRRERSARVALQGFRPEPHLPSAAGAGRCFGERLVRNFCRQYFRLIVDKSGGREYPRGCARSASPRGPRNARRLR